MIVELSVFIMFIMFMFIPTRNDCCERLLFWRVVLIIIIVINGWQFCVTVRRQWRGLTAMRRGDARPCKGRLEPTAIYFPENWIVRGEVANNIALYDATNNLSEQCCNKYLNYSILNTVPNTAVYIDI